MLEEEESSEDAEETHNVPPLTASGDNQRVHPCPRQRIPRPRHVPHKFDSGWVENYNPSCPLPAFNPRPRLETHDHEPGPINIPPDINASVI